MRILCTFLRIISSLSKNWSKDAYLSSDSHEYRKKLAMPRLVGMFGFNTTVYTNKYVPSFLLFQFKFCNCKFNLKNVHTEFSVVMVTLMCQERNIRNLQPWLSVSSTPNGT